MPGPPAGRGAGLSSLRSATRASVVSSIPAIEAAFCRAERVTSVQVIKDPIGSKGARLTTRISLPSRYLVFMPEMNHIGVSQRIEDEIERERLKSCLEHILPSGVEGGYIVRTAAEGALEPELKSNQIYLAKLWESIQRKMTHAESGMIIHEDLPLFLRALRDYITTQTERVRIDDLTCFERAKSFIDDFVPTMTGKVEFYTGERPLFDLYGIEEEIQKSLHRKVQLKSGGHLIIDQTEAMTTIDVNTGAFVGNRNLEETIFKTNLEAATAIARQLRVRNLGGIIIIDFIDMAEEGNRKKLYDEMRRELNRDRAKTIIYPITQLGLMQMTRQRVRQNIAERISDPCPACNGVGRVPSLALVIGALDRWLRNFKALNYDFSIMLMVSPSLAEYLYEGGFSRISRLMLRHFIRIKVQQNTALRPNEFRFISLRQHKDITQEYL